MWDIKVYGAEWCHDTQRAKSWLDNHDIAYEYIDLDESPAADELIMELNQRIGKGRKRITPTIVIGRDEIILSEPSNEELAGALGIAQPSPDNLYDVIVVGGGPAGGTAALYSSLYRFDTLLLEKLAVGGQLVTTAMVENYPGFPDGIRGSELGERLEKQIRRHGVKLEWRQVKALQRAGRILEVLCVDGQIYRSCAVILAPGSTYRHMNIPGEDRFFGRGVSFCSTCDAVFATGLDVAVVGGGNSAFEESIHLAQYARTITLLNRSEQPRANETLQDKLAAISSIKVINQAQIIEIEGDERVSGIRYRETASNRERRLQAEMVFVFIGLDPATGFLEGFLELDEHGFIKVNRRTMSTSQRGVFAAGDCVSKTLNQATLAVGEGTIAAASAHIYLRERGKCPRT